MASTRWTQTILGVAAAALLMGAAALALAGEGREARALSNCTVGSYSLDGEESAFLGLINQYRADNGLGALTVSTNLNRAAHWMGNDLGVNAYFSHTDSLGRSPYARAIDCGYPQGAGENLAAGTAWDSAQEAFVAWQNSPGHNANMLGQYYKQIGIARVNVPGSPYTWYWVTNFGATDDGTGGGGGGQPTNTPTPTRTATPTNTTAAPTATNTAVPATPTNTPTTPAGQPTNTPVPATATPTNTPGSGGGAPTPPAVPPPPSAPTNTPSSGGSGGSPTATKTPTATPSPTPVPGTPTATPTPTTPAGSLPLVPGSANLVGWPGGDGDPEESLAPIAETLEIVFRWDPVNGEWERYGPDLPWYVNSLKQMRQGEAYWVITK